MRKKEMWISVLLCGALLIGCGSSSITSNSTEVGKTTDVSIEDSSENEDGISVMTDGEDTYYSYSDDIDYETLQKKYPVNITGEYIQDEGFSFDVLGYDTKEEYFDKWIRNVLSSIVVDRGQVQVYAIPKYEHAYDFPISKQLEDEGGTSDMLCSLCAFISYLHPDCEYLEIVSNGGYDGISVIWRDRTGYYVTAGAGYVFSIDNEEPEYNIACTIYYGYDMERLGYFKTYASAEGNWEDRKVPDNLEDKPASVSGELDDSKKLDQKYGDFEVTDYRNVSDDYYLRSIGMKDYTSQEIMLTESEIEKGRDTKWKNIIVDHLKTSDGSDYFDSSFSVPILTAIDNEVDPGTEVTSVECFSDGIPLSAGFTLSYMITVDNRPLLVVLREKDYQRTDDGKAKYKCAVYIQK